MRNTKPYKAKSLSGAQRRVRDLERQVAERDDLLNRWNNERKLLAKLAAEGPSFFNPLEAMAAQTIRNEILAKMKMNPDGTFQ